MSTQPTPMPFAENTAGAYAASSRRALHHGHAQATQRHAHPSRRDLWRLGAMSALGAVGIAGAGGMGAPAAQAAGTTTRIGPITGPGLTTAFRMEATDLGIPVRCPDGRVLYIFGDTFERAGVGLGNAGFWRSPTGLYTDGSHPRDGIRFTGAVGGETAQQMLPYEHNANGLGTKIPSDVIEVDGILYLYVWNSGTEGFGTLKGTEVWSSKDNGATWQPTRANFPADAWGGIMHNMTWAKHADGFTYMFCSKYRSGDLHLFRIKTENLWDAAAYEPWGWTPEKGWAWGQPPSPVLHGRFGEMCLRELDGRYLLTFFDPEAYNIRAIVMDAPWSDLTVLDQTTLLNGGAWGAESDTSVAQLYGSYVVPGSTLGDLHLVVSQWNTTDGAKDTPYHAMHFRFQGVL